MYETLAKLSLTVEDYLLEPHKLTVVGGMERHTTVVQLQGKSLVGKGEDVTYETPEQIKFQEAGTPIDFTNVKTLGEFCDMVGDLDLFPKAKPSQEASRRYRRWAFESAALDLALRQAGKSLAEVLNRQPKPVHFIVSQRLGEPSAIDLLQARLDQYPSLRFKLDPANDWTDDLIRQLAATNAVDTLDLKGFYKGTPVDVVTDPVLYQKLLKTFPDAWFEDPDVTEETRPILEPHAARMTWDAPLHTAKDILHMPFKPKMINVKPSRFGSIQELSNVYQLCEKEGIDMYGGGQFELSVGRGQIQYLASLFHPDTPNDVAPADYHTDRLAENLPTTELRLRVGANGFSVDGYH